MSQLLALVISGLVGWAVSVLASLVGGLYLVSWAFTTNPTPDISVYEFSAVGVFPGAFASVLASWLFIGLPRQRRILLLMVLLGAGSACLEYSIFVLMRVGDVSGLLGAVSAVIAVLLPPAGALIGYNIGRRQRSAE